MAVTSEILNNMLRTSLTDLKSFVEVLNAELAEEGRGDENRASHKDGISQVLRSFGECEAYLKKSSECLHEVEAKINEHFDEVAEETIEEKALHDEIQGIIKMITGRQSSDDDNRPLLNLSIDDDKISQHLENVEDILNEFHPLEGSEDDEENEDEEERVSEHLETVLKKVMSRLQDRLNSVGSQDDQFEEEDDLSDSADDDDFDYDSLERVDNRQAEPNREAKRNMDARLKEMWNEFKQELANVQPLDTKQLFTEAIENHPDDEIQNLRYFSQFNNNILELFSREALLVVGTKMNYVDPISKKKITHPVRNIICHHIYEKDTIYGILQKKKTMRCPLLGCTCSFTVDDLMEDDDVAMRINQRESVERTDTENMETEDEDSCDSPDVGNDNNDSQVDLDTEDEDRQVDVGNEDCGANADDDTENADTQSQALF